MIDSIPLLTELWLSSKNRVYLDLLTPTWAMPWKFASLLVRWTTSDNGCQVLVIQCVLFRLIWSKRVLYGIWDENMHEVLMKTMCSNHFNSLQYPWKIPSCDSESVKGVGRYRSGKLGWEDPQRRTWARLSGVVRLYAGLYRTCGQFPVGIQSRPQYFASSILLINFFGFPPGSVGIYVYYYICN